MMMMMMMMMMIMTMMMMIPDKMSWMIAFCVILVTRRRPRCHRSRGRYNHPCYNDDDDVNDDDDDDDDDDDNDDDDDDTYQELRKFL